MGKNNLTLVGRITTLLGHRPYVPIIGISLFVFMLYISFTIPSSDIDFFPLSLLALFAGLFFECLRLTDSVLTIIHAMSYSIIFSLVIFFLGYSSDSMSFVIQLWPYIFLAFFIMFFIILYKDKIKIWLTEGTTLLQSVALIYWVVDSRLYQTSDMFTKLTLAIGFMFVLYVFIHAFTSIRLSKFDRFLLSVWSSIIILIFTFNNVEMIESMKLAVEKDGVLYAVQYFILGVSSIYVVQDLLMLLRFFPNKRSPLFSDEQADNFHKLANEFAGRFSDKQVNKKHSLLFLIVASVFFSFNYYYRFIPGAYVVWITIFCFPYIVILYDYFHEVKKRKMILEKTT